MVREAHPMPILRSLGGLALALALVAVLPGTLAGGDDGTHARYIAGTHTLTGRVNNVPHFETLTLSTANAVCQQSLKHPIVPVAFSSPGVGGACALTLPSTTFTVQVEDARFGPIIFEYQPVTLTGERCGPYGVADSGEVLAVAPECAYVYVWPNFVATYGLIDVDAA